MQLLMDRILKDGKVIGNDILKVDSFLNHQLDIELFNEMGKEFKRLYKDSEITKILTIYGEGSIFMPQNSKLFAYVILKSIDGSENQGMKKSANEAGKVR